MKFCRKMAEGGETRTSQVNVEERFPKINGKVEINYVGTNIGSYTGPGTVALFFWGKRGWIKKESAIVFLLLSCFNGATIFKRLFYRKRG